MTSEDPILREAIAQLTEVESKSLRVARWLLAVVLLLAAGWSFNLTLYNWWAAGGPPVPHPELYEHRGNFFCAATVVLFIAFVSVVVTNVRRPKRSSR